jgi:threonine dehydratase
MRQLLLRDRLVAEGAAATAVGALLQGELLLDGRTVAVVLSGRNVDGHILEWLLAKPH